MPLMCELGWHRADPMARWNNGYYFSKCTRCGQDLVRTAYAGWQVPKGYKVVWRSSPPEQKIPFAVRDIPGSQMGTDAAYVEFPGKELPIEEVLRHLNARDIGADQITDDGEVEPRIGADDIALEVTRRLSRHISDALQIDRLRIGKVRIGEVRIGAAAAQERPSLAAPAPEPARSEQPARDHAEQQAAAAERDQAVTVDPDDWLELRVPPELPTSPEPAALQPEPSDPVMEVQRTGLEVPPEFEQAAAAADSGTPSPLGAAEPMTETLPVAEADPLPAEEAPLQQAESDVDGGGADADADADAAADAEEPAEVMESKNEPSPPAAPAPPPWIVDFDAFMEDDSDVVSWDADPLPTKSTAQAIAQPVADESVSADAPLPTEEETIPAESLEAAAAQDASASPAPIVSDEDEYGSSSEDAAEATENSVRHGDVPAEEEAADAEASSAEPLPVEPAEVEPIQAEADHDREPALDAREQAPEPLSMAPVTQGRTARNRFWSNDPALRPAPNASSPEPGRTIPLTGQVAVGALVLATVLGLAALISDAPGTSSVSVTQPAPPRSASSVPPQPAPQTAQATPLPQPGASNKDTVPPAAAQPSSAGNDVLGAQDIWTSASKTPGQAAPAVTGTGFVTASILNCRKAPEENADSVRKLSRGATVKIVGRRTEWMNVSHRGRECWALARYISPSRPS